VGDIYRFGPFELHADRYELRREGARVPLEPKPLEVLTELLRHAGELVTKSELMESVWAERVVTESVIARCISKLRSALDDDSQTLVHTVHGYGYRFMGEVTCIPDPMPHVPPQLPLAAPRAGDAPPLRPNWRLLRALDERGAVWLARHAKTGEQRVFKFGLEPEQIRALRREIAIQRLLRQGLGERGDIARLLDFNLHTLPYFLELEYCPDGNLADWAATAGGLERLPLATRVELVAQAAETLAAAHGLGVLHQDIKPSNLLVWHGADGTPRIRWADFGSGRLLEPERLAALGITQLGSTRTLAHDTRALQGTLNYVAPELLRGEAPTVRSDLYALGIVLYQVLTGDLRTPMTVGWEERITDELLRSDVAACAHDNPAQRLSSAAELAVRLRTLEERRRRLCAERERQAQAARLARRLERARARRPWLAAALGALLAGTAISLWQYRGAVHARDAARAQAAVAQAVVRFLDQDILAAGSPFTVGGDDGSPLTVRKAVDRAAAGLSGRFADEPEVEAAIRATIGQVYVEDGDYTAAEREIRAAVSLARRMPGEVDELIVRAQYALAFTLAVQQKFTEARGWLEQANEELGGRRSVSAETLQRRDTINGNFYFTLQDFRAAIPWFERALAETPRTNPRDVSQLAIRQTSLAWCYAATGRFADARPLYAAALAEVKAAEPRGGTLTGTIEERYGIGLFLAGRSAEARTMLQSAYAELKRAIGNDGLTAEALTFLGWLELREGAAATAVATLREAYREEVASAGALHRMSLRARACLGLAEIASGARTSGLLDLTAAVSGYEHELGSGAAETQLFTVLLLESTAGTAAQPADAVARLSELTPERVAEAAPWEDWAPHLTQLRAQLEARHTSPLAKTLTSRMGGT